MKQKYCAGKWPQVIWFAVQLIIHAAAYYLLSPKGGGGNQAEKSSNPLDDSTTYPSVRGTLCPLLLGRNKLGPVIGYVGGRYTEEEEVEQQ